MKKPRPPKKMSPEESDAAYVLSSAVIRGVSKEHIDELRKKLEDIRAKRRKNRT